MSRYEGSIADQMFDLVTVRGWAADCPGDSPAAVLPGGDEAAALLRSVLPHQLQSPPTPGIVILSSCYFKLL